MMMTSPSSEPALMPEGEGYVRYDLSPFEDATCKDLISLALNQTLAVAFCKMPNVLLALLECSEGMEIPLCAGDRLGWCMSVIHRELMNVGPDDPGRERAMVACRLLMAPLVFLADCRVFDALCSVEPCANLADRMWLAKFLRRSNTQKGGVPHLPMVYGVGAPSAKAPVSQSGAGRGQGDAGNAPQLLSLDERLFHARDDTAREKMRRARVSKAGIALMGVPLADFLEVTSLEERDVRECRRLGVEPDRRVGELAELCQAWLDPAVLPKEPSLGDAIEVIATGFTHWTLLLERWGEPGSPWDTILADDTWETTLYYLVFSRLVNFERTEEALS